MLLSLFGAIAVAAETTVSGQPKPPNVLVILADDLGIDAVGAYGGQSYQTPQIDRLAREGIKFTNMHSNPYCTPSRSELLTGRYPFSTDTSYVMYDPAKHKFFLDPAKHPSYPRQLKQIGYRTAIAGKWQVSFLGQRDTVRDFGFDEYLCWQIIGENGEKTSRHYQPYFRRNGRVVAEEYKDRYGPDVLCDFMIDFIKTNRAGPFLAYYTSVLPHYPWLPTPDSKDQTMPKGENGDKKFFPDMVAYLDKDVGRLLKTLDDLGIAENTIVIFMGDNGTDPRIISNYQGQNTAGGKATMTDRGTRVPFLVRWPAKIAAGRVDDQLIEFADFLPTICDLTGAPQPTEKIHGRSAADRVLGKVQEDSAAKPVGKPWIHAERANERYVRSDHWMLFHGTGAVKQVQIYPKDPIAKERSELSEPDRAEVEMLRTAIRGLKEPFSASRDPASEKCGEEP